MITVINNLAVSAALDSLRTQIARTTLRAWLGVFTQQVDSPWHHMLGTTIGPWSLNEHAAVRNWARRGKIPA